MWETTVYCRGLVFLLLFHIIAGVLTAFHMNITSGMPVTENDFRGKSKYSIKGALIMFLEVKSKLFHLKWAIDMHF